MVFLFFCKLLCRAESSREWFTNHPVFISVESIYIERFYLCCIKSFVVWYNFWSTLFILLLSFWLCCKVRTVQISFTFYWYCTSSHELYSIFCMRYARFLDISCFPEFPEIEIIIICLNTESCKQNDAKSYSKSSFDNFKIPKCQNNYTNNSYKP